MSHKACLLRKGQHRSSRVDFVHKQALEFELSCPALPLAQQLEQQRVAVYSPLVRMNDSCSLLQMVGWSRWLSCIKEKRRAGSRTAEGQIFAVRGSTRQTSHLALPKMVYRHNISPCLYCQLHEAKSLLDIN